MIIRQIQHNFAVHVKPNKITLMKNLLLIMLSLFLSGSLFAMTDGGADENPKEIEIRTGRDPESNIATINPREVVPIEALLYCNSGDIVFSFLTNIGEVTITVNDADGNVVAMSTCDSSVSNTATMTVPTLSGSYTISIVGEQFTGEGSYEL